MTAEASYRRELIQTLTFEVVPAASIEAASAALPPASRVSVTCSPVKGIDATVALTDRLLTLGHTPVPHLAARMVSGPDHVRRLARWLRTEGHRTIFVIAGDANPPLGPYHDALTFLRVLLDADPNLEQIGVPAYPDGHSFIGAKTLQDALYAKESLLTEAGIRGYAVTQMCFDPAKIDAWLQAQRHYGLTLPIHLGLAGVVSRTKLITMGARLGVGASLRYLSKNKGAVGRLLTSSDYEPDKLLEPLGPILAAAGIKGIHCFTFNQVEATAAWRRRALERL